MEGFHKKNLKENHPDKTLRAWQPCSISLLSCLTHHSLTLVVPMNTTSVCPLKQTFSRVYTGLPAYILQVQCTYTLVHNSSSQVTNTSFVQSNNATLLAKHITVLEDSKVRVFIVSIEASTNPVTLSQLAMYPFWMIKKVALSADLMLVYNTQSKRFPIQLLIDV